MKSQQGWIHREHHGNRDDLPVQYMAYRTRGELVYFVVVDVPEPLEPHEQVALHSDRGDRFACEVLDWALRRDRHRLAVLRSPGARRGGIVVPGELTTGRPHRGAARRSQ
jgi:hypothetical protein